jgi:uncharacterized protein (DUF1810 family)
MEHAEISRFRHPVREHIDAVVSELSAGCKRTHWMWFMFPQLRSLGFSEMAQRYGVADLSEARGFLSDGELGSTYERLVGIVHDQVVVGGRGIHDVFGSPDDAKLVSSLTLFQRAAELEGRVELMEQCGQLLDLADQQGLRRCAVTVAACE